MIWAPFLYLDFYVISIPEFRALRKSRLNVSLTIVRGLDREDTLNNIFDAIPDIEDDEMKKLAEVLIGKLDIMSDAEFREIGFDETFEN